jgi:pimeloyl-ACP methyl ester carboxylesterase
VTTPAPLAVLSGITAATHATARLAVHALERGPRDGDAVVLLHGNVSAARFWEETMLALPQRAWALAPDLRGYGRTEERPIDATRGLRDFADDLEALLVALGRGDARVHLVGWSVGAGVAMQYAIDRPARVASLALVAPMSPYGFGGTRDAAGAPCAPDFAGSGGATAAAELVQRIAAGDASDESALSPRSVLRQFYVRPPFRVDPAREDVLVEEILSSSTAPGCYPGDSTPSAAWPGIAPGRLGMNNAISPAYCDLSPFARIAPRPPVLWIRGADDQIVSDTSMFDLGYLGQLGAVPGWPGADVYPPQPMVAQVRAVLDAYRAAGGRYREVVLPAVGHAPHLEAPEAFRAALGELLAEAGAAP